MTKDWQELSVDKNIGLYIFKRNFCVFICKILLIISFKICIFTYNLKKYK